MSQYEAPAIAAWMTWWRLMRRYHRFRTFGLEHLAGTESRLVVGYHGRGIAHDLCLLSAVLYDEFGYLPHGVVHAAARKLPVMRQVIDQLQMIPGDDEATVRAIIARGEHIIVAPGGTREACRPARVRYRVDWGGRVGYLRFAARYGLSVVPVAAAGVDDTYIGLNDGYQTGKRLRVPLRLPLWFGLGLGGAFPLALPLPVRITQLIGPPIPVDVDPDDRAGLEALNRRVVEQVQSQLDHARSL